MHNNWRCNGKYYMLNLISFFWKTLLFKVWIILSRPVVHDERCMQRFSMSFHNVLIHSSSFIIITIVGVMKFIVKILGFHIKHTITAEKIQFISISKLYWLKMWWPSVEKFVIDFVYHSVRIINWTHIEYRLNLWFRSRRNNANWI